jgi:hypothetical protein
MGEKKEIIVNKRKLKWSLKSILLSMTFSFLILFIVSLFGEISNKKYTDFKNINNVPKDVLIYHGVLVGENGYGGAGWVEKWGDSYFIYDNLFYDFYYTKNLNFEQKAIMFYIPVVLFENFWLFIALTLILFIGFKFIKNYYIKFE